MQIINPNNEKEFTDIARISVFLGGGCTTSGWRDEFFTYIKQFILSSLVIWDPYNPEITDVYTQIKWELDKINSCDILSVYFDKYTDQPISMLELGKMFELAKDKCVHVETSIGKTAVYTQYGKPLIVGVHPEAPKREDILIQCQLAGYKAFVCSPQDHAKHIIEAHQDIKSQMK
jgi:hypothetical protein